MNQFPILKKYLNDENFSQNLIYRQKEIDGVLENYVWLSGKKEIEKLANNSLIKIAKLYNLRMRINQNQRLKLQLYPQLFSEIYC